MVKSPDRNLIADCSRDLGLTVAEVRSIASTAPRRYFIWEVVKRSGGTRTICHPASELKAIQEYFLTHVLQVLPVHASATAYVKGSSIKRNAQAHATARVVLKVDFKNFFNNLVVGDWRNFAADHFPYWSQEELEFSSRILFWGNKSYAPKCLAIGAPTSPLLSNALLFDVDDRLNKFSARNGLVYTRYADDITCSSQGKLDQKAVLREIKKALSEARYSSLKINNKKTAMVSNRFALRITGLVITPDHKVSLGRDRKRTISSMVHRQKLNLLDPADRNKLRGLIAFAQDVEPSFVLMLRKKYGRRIVDGLLKWGAEFAS